MAWEVGEENRKDIKKFKKGLTNSTLEILMNCVLLFLFDC